MPDYIVKNNAIIYQSTFVPPCFLTCAESMGFQISDNDSVVYLYKFNGSKDDFLTIIELCKESK